MPGWLSIISYPMPARGIIIIIIVKYICIYVYIYIYGFLVSTETVVLRQYKRSKTKILISLI